MQETYFDYNDPNTLTSMFGAATPLPGMPQGLPWSGYTPPETPNTPGGQAWVNPQPGDEPGTVYAASAPDAPQIITGPSIGVRPPAGVSNPAQGATAPTSSSNWYNPNGQQGNLLSNLNNLSGLTAKNFATYGSVGEGTYDPVSGSWNGPAPWDTEQLRSGFTGYGQDYEPVIGPDGQPTGRYKTTYGDPTGSENDIWNAEYTIDAQGNAIPVSNTKEYQAGRWTGGMRDWATYMAAAAGAGSLASIAAGGTAAGTGGASFGAGGGLGPSWLGGAATGAGEASSLALGDAAAGLIPAGQVTPLTAAELAAGGAGSFPALSAEAAAAYAGNAAVAAAPTLAATVPGAATPGAGVPPTAGVPPALQTVGNAVTPALVKGAIGAVTGGSGTNPSGGGSPFTNFLNGLTGGSGGGDFLNSLLGSYFAKEQSDKANNLYSDQINQINQLYSPDSAYAKQMQQAMERKDAAAGRNSQYGTRGVELAAALTDSKSKAINSANMTNLIGSKINAQNQFPASLLALLQNSGTKNAIGSAAGSITDWLTKLFGGTGNTGTGTGTGGGSDPNIGPPYDPGSPAEEYNPYDPGYPPYYDPSNGGDEDVFWNGNP